jgi:hypothetical protein
MRFLLQIRVGVGGWQTKTVALSHAEAAMAATAAVHEEIANGCKHIAVRVVSDADAEPPAR